MNTDELRSAAKKRLKAQHDFKQFLAVWGAVSVLLIVIWLLTGAWGYFWPIWPIFVTGVAVLFVGLDAYGPPKHITEDAIDAEVARLVERQQQRDTARAAAAQPAYDQTQQYNTGQTASYDPSMYQQGQSGQAPVYDPTQYQGQTASYDTARYQNVAPTQQQESVGQGYHGSQQYGTYGAPSSEAAPAEARTTEPTPTEQFAAVFSGTDASSASSSAPTEPAESIVLESTSTGDTATVTAAADETQARLDGEAPTEHVSAEGASAGDAAVTEVAAPRKTTTRSTTTRKPATKATTAAGTTAAGTTVRKTSSTRASTGTAAPKSTTPKTAAKAPTAKTTSTTGTKRTTSATTTGTPKAAAAKAPAKPRTTKPKVAPTDTSSPSVGTAPEANATGTGATE